MELITRRIIADLEGEEAAKNPERIKAYATTDSLEYQCMINALRDRFALKSLKYTKIEDLIAAIGLPKCKVCTFCFDGVTP
jgi:amidophosphoribosyltransferase